jgi:small subunit ribosomal protein S6
VKRNYEVALVFPAGKGEEDYKGYEARVTSWIELNDGAVKATNTWGRRRLAYQIGQHREGYYVFLKAELESTNLNDLERRMNIDTDIIRYLIVREDEA